MGQNRQGVNVNTYWENIVQVDSDNNLSGLDGTDFAVNLESISVTGASQNYVLTYNGTKPIWSEAQGAGKTIKAENAQDQVTTWFNDTVRFGGQFEAETEDDETLISVNNISADIINSGLLSSDRLRGDVVRTDVDKTISSILDFTKNSATDGYDLNFQQLGDADTAINLQWYKGSDSVATNQRGNISGRYNGENGFLEAYLADGTNMKKVLSLTHLGRLYLRDGDNVGTSYLDNDRIEYLASLSEATLPTNVVEGDSKDYILRLTNSGGTKTYSWNESTEGSGNGINEYSDDVSYKNGEVVRWTDDNIYVWTSSSNSTAGTDPSEDTTNWVELSKQFNGGTIEGETTIEDTLTIDRPAAGLFDIIGDSTNRTAVTSRIRGFRGTTQSWGIEGYQVSSSNNNDSRVSLLGRGDNSMNQFLRYDPSANPLVHGLPQSANAIIDIKNIDGPDDFALVLDRTGLNIESNQGQGLNFFTPAGVLEPAAVSAYFRPDELFMQHPDNATNKNAIIWTARNNSTVDGKKDLLRLRAQGHSTGGDLDNTFSDVLFKGDTNGEGSIYFRIMKLADEDNISDDNVAMKLLHDKAYFNYNGYDEKVLAAGSYANVIIGGTEKGDESNVSATGTTYTVTKYGPGSTGVYVVTDFGGDGVDTRIDYTGDLSEDGTTIPTDILLDGNYSETTDSLGLNQGNAERTTDDTSHDVTQYLLDGVYYYRVDELGDYDEAIVVYTGDNTEADDTFPSDLLTHGKYTITDTKNFS